MVGYLQSAFPDAAVNIRNGSDETLALVYARLVMANQTFTGPATFGVFPAIVSFGTGYVQEGSLSYFASSNANARNNVEMVRGPMLDSKRISKTKELNELLEWMHEDRQHRNRESDTQDATSF